MSLLELSLFLFFVGGLTIITYKNYAQYRSWDIGTLYLGDGNYLKIVAMISQVGSFIAAFFYVKWYVVLIGAVIGWGISGVITALFKAETQIIGPVFILCATLLYLLIKIQIL